MYTEGAEALALNAQGDLYAALMGRGASAGLKRLRADERAASAAQSRAAVFDHALLAFDVEDRALAADVQGRIWMAVRGQPQIAVFDPASGQVRRFQYAAPSIAANPPHGVAPGSITPQPGAVWLQHITVMATDSAGHLWFIRDGNDQIEEVAA